jgi:RNA-directed DNA polymerase
MPTSLWAIADKARVSKQHRFGGLARLLTPGNLKRSFGRLKKKAAPGVDKVTWQEYQRDLDANVERLGERLKANQYRAGLVRRKYIPKPNGKRRPLGLLKIEDKTVQRAATSVVEAIYEEDFLKSSYGYHPGRGAKDAVSEVTKQLQFGRFRWVVEADIKGFFDHIDHEKLMGMLGERIQDGRFLRLIRKWLKAGILEETGAVINPETGTPQGGIITPRTHWITCWLRACAPSSYRNGMMQRYHVLTHGNLLHDGTQGFLFFKWRHCHPVIIC